MSQQVWTLSLGFIKPPLKMNTTGPFASTVIEIQRNFIENLKSLKKFQGSLFIRTQQYLSYPHLKGGIFYPNLTKINEQKNQYHEVIFTAKFLPTSSQ